MHGTILLFFTHGHMTRECMWSYMYYIIHKYYIMHFNAVGQVNVCGHVLHITCIT